MGRAGPQWYFFGYLSLPYPKCSLEIDSRKRCGGVNAINGHGEKSELCTGGPSVGDFEFERVPVPLFIGRVGHAPFSKNAHRGPQEGIFGKQSVPVNFIRSVTLAQAT